MGTLFIKIEIKNGKKRLEIGKTILFHIHKHCTTHFSKPTIHFYKPIAHFHSFWTKSSKFEAGKIIQKWTIWVFKGPPKGLPTVGDITYLQLDPNFAKIGPAGPELA